MEHAILAASLSDPGNHGVCNAYHQMGLRQVFWTQIADFVALAQHDILATQLPS
jgi:hypothetical protein